MSRIGLTAVSAAALAVTACSGGPQPTSSAPTATGSPPASAVPTSAEPSTAVPTSEPPTSEASTTPSPTSPAPTSQPGEVSIAFVGDVMLGRSIGDRILEGEDPFAGVVDELAAADLVVGTLETTVGMGGQPEDKTFTFQAPPEAVDSLRAAGFDLVALANNHSYDYGADGLTGTIRLLDHGGLQHVGAGTDATAARAPVILSAGGIDTAFLAYVDVPDDWTGYRNRDWEATRSRPGVAWAQPDDIAADVTAAAQDSDHVVVLLHAGAEGSQEPTEVQRAAADAALEAGATAVIGGHPHVLQGSRAEAGQFTAWSLGNFVFDGFGDDPLASQSAILTLTLDEVGVSDSAWIPVDVTGGFPLALDPGSEQGRAILERVESRPVER